jgi:ribosomal protein L3
MQHRQIGSIGASSDPSHTYRGQKMAGRMGNCHVTVQNLEVIKVDKDNNILVLKGAVPGPDGRLLVVRKAKKKAKILPKKKPVFKKKKEQAAKEKKFPTKPAAGKK